MIRSFTDRKGSRTVATFAICWLLVWLCMNLLLKGCKNFIVVSYYCLSCMVPILFVNDVNYLLNGYMIWILLTLIVICEGRYKWCEAHLHWLFTCFLSQGMDLEKITQNIKFTP